MATWLRIAHARVQDHGSIPAELSSKSESTGKKKALVVVVVVVAVGAGHLSTSKGYPCDLVFRLDFSR